MKSKVDTVAIQDAMRDKIAETVATILGRGLGAAPVEKITDAILSLPEIEAGLALYLGSIEEREPS